MYTVIEDDIRYIGDIKRNRIMIQVDTAGDVPDPDESWDTGSICMIAETHAYKVLNSEREWV